MLERGAPSVPTFQEARAIVAEHLERASLLGPTQRENIWRKVDDLSQGRLVWKSTPLRVQLEPNRTCNLACLHCDIRHRPTYVLDARVIESLFDEVGAGCIEVMPYAGGEPTLAPLREMAPLMRRHGCYYSFTTNGLLMTGDYFRTIADVTGRVTFSVHGHTPEIFARMVPGADFDLIVRNMRECLRIAEATGAQMLCGLVINRFNFEQLPAWFEWIGDLGFRHAGLTNLYPGTQRMDQLGVDRSPQETEDVVGRAMRVAIARGIFVETNVPEAYYTRFPENRPTRRSPFEVFADLNGLPGLFRPGFCPLVANTIMVEWDGTVLPCVRQHYPLGNLHRERFSALWNGERMQRLRATFLERALFSGCVQCRDFFCDSQHPGQPAVRELGHSFADEFPG